jgi:cytochrome c peroxidase
MMTRRGFFSRAIGCALLALMIPDRLWAAQTAPASAPTLIGAGDVSTPLLLAPAELKTLPRTRVEVKEDGRTLIYEGVLVREILKRAGVPLGAEKFKAPTLRNIAVTAPYMHDGSVATLEDAIDHYAAGGRTISEGAYRGVGRDNANKSPTIRGFTLTSAQRADLVAFLQSLTDEELLRDPRFANPSVISRKR